MKWHVHHADTMHGLPGGVQCRDQLPDIRWLSPRLGGGLQRRDLLLGVQGRRGRPMGGPARDDGGGLPDGIQPAECQRLLPDLHAGRRHRSGTRYAAIFAKQDIPSAAQWTVTGRGGPSLAGFDHTMQTFMQANGVRAAQLAIGKNGVTKFSRAYTWAEPGYRVTQPSDRFLLASCSKMFLEAAVQSLYDAKKLAPPPRCIRCSASRTRRSAQRHHHHPATLDHMGGYDDHGDRLGVRPDLSDAPDRAGPGARRTR